LSRNLPILPRGSSSEALLERHIYPGEPGLPPTSTGGEEGVNYLRRLKEEKSGGRGGKSRGTRGHWRSSSSNGRRISNRSDQFRVERAAPKPTASLFGQRGVSSRRQRRAHVGNAHRHQLHG